MVAVKLETFGAVASEIKVEEVKFNVVVFEALSTGAVVNIHW